MTEEEKKDKPYIWICENCGRMHLSTVKQGDCPCNNRPPMRMGNMKLAKSYSVKEI